MGSVLISADEYDEYNEQKDEIERLRNALEKYDCLHKCTEPCALYHLEKAKEDKMPHMICGWWASEVLMEKSK